ncbi:hypothetical protein [Massilia sp. Se16.2.3]|uniref:hypothetical protein n=1 Tax=Massilia sp. Se16.2.3 TaxID=2709303 RepID=UPI001AED3C3C|nr:hypothetical protein [Massilia sp. Se16.2.3]
MHRAAGFPIAARQVCSGKWPRPISLASKASAPRASIGTITGRLPSPSSMTRMSDA